MQSATSTSKVKKPAARPALKSAVRRQVNTNIPLGSPLEAMLRAAVDRLEVDARAIIADRARILAAALDAGQPAPWNLSREELFNTAKACRHHLLRARAGLADGRRMRVAAALIDIRIELSRIDCATFTEFVIKTETGRKPIRLTEMHREWHRMADESENVIIWAHINSGKSSMFVLPRVLWELGRDREKRIIIVSETSLKAKKIARPMSAAIRYSVELRQVFPLLRPSVREGEPWNTTEMTVDRPNFSKDASITIVSAMNPASQGSRVDIAFFDDVLTRRTARKPEQQTELKKNLQAEVMGRFVEGGRLVAVNTAWKQGDYLNHLKATLPNVRAERYGVYDHAGEIRCPWISQKWIDARIAGLGPVEINRQLHVVDQEDEDSKFEEEWIRKSKALGEGIQLIYGFTEEERARLNEMGYITVVGVDLAASEKKRTGAQTVLTALLIYPDGDHQVLWIDAGRYTAPTIRDKIVAFHQRYGAVVFVETNGVQKFVLQIVTDVSDVPVLPFQTGSNKLDPAFGVESLGILMANNKFVLPSKGGIGLGQIEEFLSELRAYRPQKHPGDCIMSMWIAKEGGRQLRLMGGDGGGEADIA